MKFTVVAVGKLKQQFWTDACAEYLKRLQPYVSTTVREIADVDPARVGGPEGAQKKEAAGIMAALAPSAYVILLAIEGKQRTSTGLADHFNRLALDNVNSITFILGGSVGVSKEVRARANETLSFGAITLPHNLARLVLLEQLYRSQKILRGEPYHK